MSYRSLTLPTASGASWAYFAWPTHDVHDVLDYTVACGPWLDDANGLTIVGVDVSRSADLLLDVSEPVIDSTHRNVVVRIGGGTANTTASIAFLLRLSNQAQVLVVIGLPIVDRGFGLLPIDDPSVTYLVDGYGNRIVDGSGNALVSP